MRLTGIVVCTGVQDGREGKGVLPFPAQHQISEIHHRPFSGQPVSDACFLGVGVGSVDVEIVGRLCMRSRDGGIGRRACRAVESIRVLLMGVLCVVGG